MAPYLTCKVPHFAEIHLKQARFAILRKKEFPQNKETWCPKIY
jgi:hypothetical protein